MPEYPPEFLTALSFVLRDDIEGGYVNNRDDPGGETNLGVTARVYKRYCLARDIKPKPMRMLAFADVQPIYFTDYWQPACSDVEFPLSVLVFDCAVNMGPGRAIRYKKMTRNPHEYARLRWERYLARVKEHPASVQFLPGWCQRLRKCLKFMGWPPMPLLDDALAPARAAAKVWKEQRKATA